MLIEWICKIRVYKTYVRNPCYVADIVFDFRVT